MRATPDPFSSSENAGIFFSLHYEGGGGGFHRDEDGEGRSEGGGSGGGREEGDVGEG